MNCTRQTQLPPALQQSRALQFAVAAGLPPRMAYTVTETERYTGIPRKQLYAAHRDGELPFVLPKGCSKGNRITVDAMDAWLASRCG